MTKDPAMVQFRALKKSDLQSFDEVVKQGFGHLERSTGLDRLAEIQFQSLHRAGVWTLFTLLGAIGRAPIKIYVGADGRVLGTASEIPLPKAAYVLGVATDASMRNRGIATALLEMVHAEASRTGRSWAALDVEADNEVAIRIYKRAAYEEVARFGWYVGPVPDGKVEGVGRASVVRRRQMEELARWVGSTIPPRMREALPPDRRMLSHIDLLVRYPRAPIRTWKLGTAGETKAAVTASYASEVSTGYIILVAEDPSAGRAELGSALAPAVEWVRSLGGTRLVAVARLASDDRGNVLAGLGLALEVTTVLMVKRLEGGSKGRTDERPGTRPL